MATVPCPDTCTTLSKVQARVSTRTSHAHYTRLSALEPAVALTTAPTAEPTAELTAESTLDSGAGAALGAGAPASLGIVTPSPRRVSHTSGTISPGIGSPLPASHN